MAVNIVKEFPRLNDHHGVHVKWPGLTKDNSYQLKFFAGGQVYGWSVIFEDFVGLMLDTCHIIKTPDYEYRLKNSPLLEDWGIHLNNARVFDNERIILNFHNTTGHMFEMGRIAPFWLASLIITPTPKEIFYVSGSTD